MSDTLVSITTSLALIVGYAAAATLFPISQWSRGMMGRPALEPYRDIPLEMFKENRKRFLNPLTVAAGLTCAVIAPPLGILGRETTALAVVGLIVFMAPLAYIMIVTQSIWNAYKATHFNGSGRSDA